ncbi:MAG: HPr family phosphocarrier protein [Acidaminococcaceae bacterium]|jgi:phosphocarrier protein HPr|nr:HPr family phosphocarrier protein [Acidaminococcaceae bacterium]
MQEFTYTIKDPEGIHARPAGVLVKEATKFKSKLTLKAGAKSADLKRIFAVMTLGVKSGAAVTVTAEGEDEAAAIAALSANLKANL